MGLTVEGSWFDSQQGQEIFPFSKVYSLAVGPTHTSVQGENGKAVPLQAWTDPEGSRRLRLPDFLRQSAHEDGKVVSRMHQPPIPPGIIPGTHFC
jgi:hypothetical protein